MTLPLSLFNERNSGRTHRACHHQQSKKLSITASLMNKYLKLSGESFRKSTIKIKQNPYNNSSPVTFTTDYRKMYPIQKRPQKFLRNFLASKNLHLVLKYIKTPTI